MPDEFTDYAASNHETPYPAYDVATTPCVGELCHASASSAFVFAAIRAFSVIYAIEGQECCRAKR